MKKILSLALALIMIISTVNIPVSAATSLSGRSPTGVKVFVN